MKAIQLVVVLHEKLFTYLKSYYLQFRLNYLRISLNIKYLLNISKKIKKYEYGFFVGCFKHNRKLRYKIICLRNNQSENKYEMF